MISLLCITKLEPHAEKFLLHMELVRKALGGELVLGVDNTEDAYKASPIACWKPTVHFVKSKGYLESVHDECVEACHGSHVLRLDDDEKCSRAMINWLTLGKYLAEPHWKFPRAHLWPGQSVPHMLRTVHLWPDVQTRLSRKDMAGGRSVIHCGSPFGGGTEAPVLIEHHKFLVKSLDQRRELVERYNGVLGNAGTAFAYFSVPEDAYKGETHKLVPMNDGRTDTGHYADRDCGGCGKWITL